MPIPLPSGGPSYRIRQGESIGAQAFSSVAMTFGCRFRAVFDDGSSEIVVVDDFTTDATRAVQYARSGWVARKDGIVTEGVAHISGGSAAQPRRGQTFVRAFISPSEADLVVLSVLFQSYLYRGFSPTLGMQVEPGPSGGGHGWIRTITTADPAAGADVAVQAVPTGATWLIHSYQVTCVQGITQTPTPRLNIEDAAGVDKVFIPVFQTQAVSTTELYTWFIETQARRVVPTGGTPHQLMPLPAALYLPEGYQVGTSTVGLGANTDYSVAELIVEEWIAATVA